MLGISTEVLLSWRQPILRSTEKLGPWSDQATADSRRKIATTLITPLPSSTLRWTSAGREDEYPDSRPQSQEPAR